jgi:hypothetical protein
VKKGYLVFHFAVKTSEKRGVFLKIPLLRAYNALKKLQNPVALRV